MSKMILSTVNNVRRGYKRARSIYNVGKKLFKAYKKFRGRRKRTSMKKAYVPDYRGRVMKPVNINLNKNQKMMERKCLTFKKQKLMLYKNALVAQTQRIYYFHGVYKAIERGKWDNTNYSSEFTGGKTTPNNVVYGGALGYGRTGATFTASLNIALAYELRHGNCIAFDADMPTSMMLPGNFTNDFDIGGGTSYPRKFGLYAQNIYGGKEINALNQTEDVTCENTPIPLANIIPPDDILGIATIRYQYNIEFNNLSKIDHWGIVVVFKLNNFISGDTATWKGFSNLINYQRAGTNNVADPDLIEGRFPSSLFKVIKVKKVLLKGTYNLSNCDQGKNYGTIRVSSDPSSYLSVCRRPEETRQETASEPTSNWWSETYHKNTFVFVYSIPCIHELGAGATDWNSPIPAGEVQCVIEKRTAYCVVKN